MLEQARGLAELWWGEFFLMVVQTGIPGRRSIWGETSGERSVTGMRKEGSWEGAWWLRDHMDEGRGLGRRCCPETQDPAAPKQTSLLSQSLSP